MQNLLDRLVVMIPIALVCLLTSTVIHIVLMRTFGIESLHAGVFSLSVGILAMGLDHLLKRCYERHKELKDEHDRNSNW